MVDSARRVAQRARPRRAASLTSGHSSATSARDATPRGFSCWPQICARTIGHGGGSPFGDNYIKTAGKWDNLTLDGTFAGGSTGYMVGAGEQCRVTGLAIVSFGPCPGSVLTAQTVGGASLTAGGWGVINTVAGSRSTSGWVTAGGFAGWADGTYTAGPTESQISPEQQIITTSGQGIAINLPWWYTPQPPWGFNIYARPVAQVLIGASASVGGLTSLTVTSATPITAANQWNQSGGSLVVVATPVSGLFNGVPGFCQFNYTSITGTTFNGLTYVPPTTTVGSGSNGGTISNIATWGGVFGGNGVLDVGSSTALWPTSGTLVVQTTGNPATITYTGTSGSTFTGCVWVSGGGASTVQTGFLVEPLGGSLTTVPVSALVANGNGDHRPAYQQVAANVSAGAVPNGTPHVWSSGSYAASVAPTSALFLSTNLYLTGGPKGPSDGGDWNEKFHGDLVLTGGGCNLVIDGVKSPPNTSNVTSFEYCYFKMDILPASGMNGVVATNCAWLNHCQWNFGTNFNAPNDATGPHQGAIYTCVAGPVYVNCIFQILQGAYINNSRWDEELEADTATAGPPGFVAVWLQDAIVPPLNIGIDVANGSSWTNCGPGIISIIGAGAQPTAALGGGSLIWSAVPTAGGVSFMGTVNNDSKIISLAHTSSSTRNPNTGSGPCFRSGGLGGTVWLR